MDNKSQHSYRQIFKSSALIGGSSVVTIALGIARTKALALLIGTGGMGLFGAFSSVTTLVGGIAGMGLSTSGVRQIAEAAGSGDVERIARTAGVLLRTSVILGCVGMLLLAVFCRPISTATFGTPEYAGTLTVLSVTVFLASVTGAHTALVQGMRRIQDLAALSIAGAVLSTVLSIPILYFFREKGIVPFLVTVSVLTTGTSWWYARKVRIEPVVLPTHILWQEAKILLGMGIAFMASGLMTNGVGYVTRMMIIRQMNLDAAGLFQAAWNISIVYVGFILSAMGSDYYPRLSAMSANHGELNRLVNEQTESALLMAVPGLLATLTFAPVVVAILYSQEFAPAVEVLRWQILGILGRVILWPIGFILLAKGNARAFIGVEVFTNSIHLLLLWYGMKWFGLAGLGMAFAGLYIICGLVLLPLTSRLTGFAWTRENLKLIGAALGTTLGVFGITTWRLPGEWSFGIGLVLTLAAALFSVRKIGRRMGFHSYGALMAAGRRRFWRGLGRRGAV